MLCFLLSKALSLHEKKPCQFMLGSMFVYHLPSRFPSFLSKFSLIYDYYPSLV
uniref:Uncharacterized protein n=1 Tax=Rhizophora mucronata TaxID=61149 RepID=A0A2P2PSD1_RHIMU